MKSFINLEEAIGILDQNTNKLELEEMSIIDAIGKISGERMYSNIDIPPVNKSAMDGYAVKVDDTLILNNKLDIIDEIVAGEISGHEVTLGNAIRVMTGAPIPKGADGVLRQEDANRDGKNITVKKSIYKNENICFKGEDIRKGNVILDIGTRINYINIGILASVGVSRIKVYRKPKVAFISTGSEVIDIDKNLLDGKIYNSNKYTILGRLLELGYEISYIDHQIDDEKGIGEKISEAVGLSDIVITTGGVSVGEKDLIKDSIDYTDGEKLFWKVSMKPGSSVLCSKLNNKLIISLSGNPIAALATFEILVRPTLEKLSGKEKVEIKREEAILMNDFHKRSSNTRFLRGNLNSENKVAITQINTGNGILSSALGSNCLIEVNAGSKCANEGDTVKIIRC